MAPADLYNKVKGVLRSQRGRNILVFSVFLVIATFLWWVIALNDEGQTDIRMPVRITHLPDSVTLVSQVPQSMSVSLMARGSQLLKYSIGRAPSFDIDFRLYHDGSTLRLSSTDLKGIARNTLGGAQIVLVSPDSLSIAFTSLPPKIVPVNLDYYATPGPQVTLSGTPVVSPDSVKVYVSGHYNVDISSVTTEPIRFNGINESVTRRVRLIAPAHTRLIPDSVDVTVNVEPLIFKTRKVKVEGANVPASLRLITFPSQVDVMYMIPVSDYLDTEPHIRVVADYNSITPSTGKIRLRIAEASGDLQNVQIATDSAEYIIEKLEK